MTDVHMAAKNARAAGGIKAAYKDGWHYWTCSAPSQAPIIVAPLWALDHSPHFRWSLRSTYLDVFLCQSKQFGSLFRVRSSIACMVRLLTSHTVFPDGLAQVKSSGTLCLNTGFYTTMTREVAPRLDKNNLAKAKHRRRLHKEFCDCCRPCAT